VPSFGVVVAVIDSGRIALQLREDSRLWSLPGGAVDPGESLVEAAVREVREETGLEVQLTRLVGVYSRPKWLNGGDHNVLFAAVPVGGDIHGFAGAETIEAAYVDPAELPESLVWWHRRMIADAVSGACGVAWTLNATWPFEGDRRSVVEQMRRDPALVERARASFAALPGPDDERLELRSVRAQGSDGS
jgi:ADP-ribose pyrophosphatase YjhB (NUDIX family)